MQERKKKRRKFEMEKVKKTKPMKKIRKGNSEIIK
jgi:hypothetical protein